MIASLIRYVADLQAQLDAAVAARADAAAAHAQKASEAQQTILRLQSEVSRPRTRTRTLSRTRQTRPRTRHRPRTRGPAHRPAATAGGARLEKEPRRVVQCSPRRPWAHHGAPPPSPQVHALRAETASADAELATGAAASELQRQRQLLESEKLKMASMKRMFESQLSASQAAQDAEKRCSSASGWRACPLMTSADDLC
jgi:hypothetical protein